jgi:hypothetical protein
MILPKGAPSFQRARDRVSVHLKCEAEVPAGASCSRLCFRVGASPCRGPFEHNFGRHAVFGLPKGQEAWDLRSEASSIVIHLDALQHAPAGSINACMDDVGCLGCTVAEGRKQA